MENIYIYWEFWWLMLGGAALILAFVNLVRALLQKHGGRQGLLFSSLSCGVLAMLFAYLSVYDWVQEGDWSALMDVVPTVTKLNGVAVCWGIALNFFAVCIHPETKPTEKEAEPHEKS